MEGAYLRWRIMFTVTSSISRFTERSAASTPTRIAAALVRRACFRARHARPVLLPLPLLLLLLDEEEDKDEDEEVAAGSSFRSESCPAHALESAAPASGGGSSR